MLDVDAGVVHTIVGGKLSGASTNVEIGGIRNKLKFNYCGSFIPSLLHH